jgi:hypothetical protein
MATGNVGSNQEPMIRKAADQAMSMPSSVAAGQ